MALFFIWQVYRLIGMFMTVKSQKLNEDVKRQAIEEYLAEQNAAKNGEGSGDSDKQDK